MLAVFAYGALVLQVLGAAWLFYLGSEQQEAWIKVLCVFSGILLFSFSLSFLSAFLELA